MAKKQVKQILDPSGRLSNELVPGKLMGMPVKKLIKAFNAPKRAQVRKKRAKAAKATASANSKQASRVLSGERSPIGKKS